MAATTDWYIDIEEVWTGQENAESFTHNVSFGPLRYDTTQDISVQQKKAAVLQIIELATDIPTRQQVGSWLNGNAWSYEGFSDLDDVLTYMINAMYANIQLNLQEQMVAPPSAFITNMLQNLNAIPEGG